MWFSQTLLEFPALAVDTHVERVSKRLKLAKKEDSVLDVERKLCREIPRTRWTRTHHQLIFFGRYFCKATAPSCADCPLFDICTEPAALKTSADRSLGGSHPPFFVIRKLEE